MLPDGLYGYIALVIVGLSLLASLPVALAHDGVQHDIAAQYPDQQEA